MATYIGEMQKLVIGDKEYSLPSSGGSGTVTSVRVQATSPVQSSTSTEQTTSLNTTISLANGYGDTKNPYGTKTANYVLAGPTSGSAAAPTFRQLVAADIPSLTVSKISDFPSTMTPSSHSHGNITNGGDITATAPTIASGDQIIINDHSASKITNGPTFDGSTTTTALTPKGTWESFSKFSGSYNDLTNKPTIPTVPTNISAFTNDVGYITSADVPEGASAYTGTISAVTSGSASSGTNNGFARGDHVHNITSSTITGALGYTPYNSTNPNGYITANHTSTYSLPLAASGTRGGVQIGYSESGTNYAVKLSSEKMYVTVPWTDTKVTTTAFTSGGSFYLTGSTSTSGATEGLYKHSDFMAYIHGSSVTNGDVELRMGNATASGTAGAKRGKIRLYTGSTGYIELETEAVASSANRTITFPNKDGTVALASDIPTVSYPVTSVNSKTGAVSLTASDVGALASSTTYVSTITTTAGAHTAISSKSGAVSFNVPTKTSHLTNDSGFITSYTDTNVTSTTSTNSFYVVGSSSSSTTTGTLLKSSRVQVSSTSTSATLTIGTGGSGSLKLCDSYNGYSTTIQAGAPTAANTVTLPTSTGTLALTSDIPTVPANIVNTITTTAGAHTAISSQTGTVSFNVPTKTSHLTNDSGFVTSSGVTSIGLTNATNGGLSVSGSPVTSSGTITVGLASAYGDTKNPYGSKTANYVLAAPNGSAGVPSFRALVAADIPDLSGTYVPVTQTGTNGSATISCQSGEIDLVTVDANLTAGTQAIVNSAGFNVMCGIDDSITSVFNIDEISGVFNVPLNVNGNISATNLTGSQSADLTCEGTFSELTILTGGRLCSHTATVGQQTFAVSFGKTFKYLPAVFLTSRNARGNYIGDLTVASLSTTGFNISIYSRESAAHDYNVTWVAIGELA